MLLIMRHSYSCTRYLLWVHDIISLIIGQRTFNVVNRISTISALTICSGVRRMVLRMPAVGTSSSSLYFVDFNANHDPCVLIKIDISLPCLLGLQLLDDNYWTDRFSPPLAAIRSVPASSSPCTGRALDIG